MVGNPNSRNCLLLIWIPQNLAPVCTYLKSEISTSLLSLLQVFFSSNSSHSILWWETLLYNYAMNIIYSWVFNFISSNKVDVICFYLEQSTALLTTGKKLLFGMATLLEPVGVSVQCHFKEPLEQWMRDSALIPLPALFNLKCLWERDSLISELCKHTAAHWYKICCEPCRKAGGEWNPKYVNPAGKTGLRGRVEVYGCVPDTEGEGNCFCSAQKWEEQRSSLMDTNTVLLTLISLAQHKKKSKKACAV